MNSLVLPRTAPWAAGEKPNAHMLNEVQDALEFLLEPPQARIAKGLNASPQTVATATWTAVTFTESHFDNLAALGPASWTPADPTGVYIRVAGWYEIELQTMWDSHATNCRTVQILLVNAPGTSAGAIDTTYGPFGRYDEFHFTDYHNVMNEVPIFLTPGDRLQMWVYHDRGSNWDLIGGSFVSDEGRKWGRANMLHLKWVSL